MTNSITHTLVATVADDPASEINKGEWNDNHVIYIDTLTGTAGGAAAAGAAITLTGGTGDGGNDAGASITVGGGSGLGVGGSITFAAGDAGGGTGGAFIGRPGSYGNPGEGGLVGLFAGSGAAGTTGAAAKLVGGEGDDGNDTGALVEAGPGDGTGNSGRVKITTNGTNGQLGQVLAADGNGTTVWGIFILAGTADPSAGAGIAANICSQYARDNGGVGELWVKTGAADTGWTKVV